VLYVGDVKKLIEDNMSDNSDKKPTLENIVYKIRGV
jgi:hypothetical protein